MAQLLVWLITLADNVKNKRLGEYLVWMMLRCSLTLSLPENLLFAELPAQICFTPLTRKKTIFHVRRKISWGWHIPHLMTKAGTTWSNYIQIMLCFPYTMFLIWAALDRGADVLKVATRWWIHPNRTIRILRDCCFWISNHTITQWVQTVLFKYFKSCIPQ